MRLRMSNGREGRRLSGNSKPLCLRKSIRQEEE